MKTLIGESRIARVVALCGLALAVCLGLLGSSQQAAAGIPSNASLAPSDPLSKVEKQVLTDTANGKSTQFLVLMSEQADVSAGYKMSDEDARGWFVYNTLKATADRTQGNLKVMLDKRGVAYKSFWAVNMVLVTGNRSLVETIAARPDVRKLESNNSFKGFDDPVDISNSQITYDNPNVTEWGVQRVNAPQVWAMGYTGQGIVVGNQDTGMRWTHNAIKPKYRGWDGTTANHNYNWWDAIHSGGGACGANRQEPCDDQGHGTHTTGTTTGDDGSGNQIGVAPGARWIGCRNMNVGNGTPATYTECFQFFLAPTDLSGQNPNPALRPHVMNNSWGCPVSEGCAADTLRQIVESSQAAGIFVIVSAGNSGSGCSTLTDPPSFYEASFSIGATDINNNLAGFSSRGPVTQDGSGRLKPNVSAPGVAVRSSVNSSDTAYSSLQGTSMAGPHAVGVVALLWSAVPSLSRNIQATKNLLQTSANPQVNVSASPPYCGNTPPTQIPNNYFGYGRVDALAAVNGAGPTATPCVSCTNTATRTVTSTPTTGSGYTYTTSTGTVVAGTDDTGNHTDDGVTSINLPFAFILYGQSYTSASVSSNGNLQFSTTSTAYTNECLPSTTITGPAIFPFWDDFRTDGTSCTPSPCGIFTSTSGSAPNRIFNIEWRATYYTGTGSANFEIRLYEGSPSRFDIIIGTISGANNSATVGVQSGTGSFTQYMCNTAVNNNTRLAFTLGGGGGSPTNTPSGSTATPTPCGTGGGWTAGPSLPTALVRGVGIWYANGLNRFYIMGGRSSDTAGSGLVNPRYYDPATGTWTVDSAASHPDDQTSNMSCADLNGPSGHRIYCVGGSAGGGTTSSPRVTVYDPVGHTITELTSDPWPAPANTVPGGQAVVNNKLYILGGFMINVSMSRQIWQFDPMAAAGARWTLKTAQVPDPGSGSNGLGYIPAAAIGNFIYTGGGSVWANATLADSQIAFRYDTVNDVVDDSIVPDMPAPGSAETRAVNVGGKIWVIGGGRTTPNPSAAVQQFDPANPGAGWTTVNSFSTARRNFPVDVDPATGKIYLAGGYAPTAATATMEIYAPPAGCSTATRTNTPGQNTATRTNTPGQNTATRTNTPGQSTSTRTNTPGQGTATWTPMRTNTPQRTGTPCVGCSMEMLAVVTSCYMDGTVHWIAIAHNPDNCGMMAPWRAELQVRNNGGNFRVVRIQYATSYFRSGDSIMDGFFCYHFSSNVRDVRVEYLFEEQDGVRGGVSKGSKEQVQEKAAPANTYSTTPDSGIPTGDSRSNPNNPNSPTCDAAMASRPMVPCQNNDGCGGGPPTPPPTGVPTRAPALPNK